MSDAVDLARLDSDVVPDTLAADVVELGAALRELLEALGSPLLDWQVRFLAALLGSPGPVAVRSGRS